MKRKFIKRRIVVALLYLNANVSFADTLAETNQQLVNTNLQAEICPQVDVLDFFGKPTGQKKDEPACAQRNRQKQMAQSAIQQQGFRADTLNGDGTSLVKPVAPPPADCGAPTTESGAINSAYYSCMNAHRQAVSKYNQEMVAYNAAVDEQNKAKLEQSNAEAESLAKNKTSSMTDGLAEIKQKNDRGQQLYTGAMAALGGIAIGNAVRGKICSATCSAAGTGCCAYAPVAFGLMAAFLVLSNKAKNQASQHGIASKNACDAFNQISSKPMSCDNQLNAQTVSFDPSTGQCQPADSEICKANPSMGAAPPNVKDALKASGLAGIKTDDLFTQLPDGSIKIKGGKTFKPSDFDSIESMIAAGIPGPEAKKFFDVAHGNNSALTKAANEVKSFKDPKSMAGSFGSGGGTNIVDVDKGAGSGKTFSDKLNKAQEEERAPSSEGLAKEFNGELIGVAGDDIFLMMNRRYKFNVDRDSFIGPAQ